MGGMAQGTHADAMLCSLIAYAMQPMLMHPPPVGLALLNMQINIKNITDSVLLLLS